MADLTDIQRAALQMLTTSARGCSLSILLTRGFAFEMLQRLVGAGASGRTTGRRRPQ
jgi:hypothetical protein